MLYFQRSTHFAEETWARNLVLNTCTRVALTTTSSRETEGDTSILMSLPTWKSSHNSSHSFPFSMHSQNWRTNLPHCMPKGGKRVVARLTHWALAWQTNHAHLHAVCLSTWITVHQTSDASPQFPNFLHTTPSTSLDSPLLSPMQNPTWSY